MAKQIINDEKHISILVKSANTIAHQVVNKISKINIAAQKIKVDSKELLKNNKLSGNGEIKEYINAVLLNGETIEKAISGTTAMLDKIYQFSFYQKNEIKYNLFFLDNLLKEIDSYIKTKYPGKIHINLNSENHLNVFGNEKMLNDVIRSIIDNACEAIIMREKVNGNSLKNAENIINIKLGKQSNKVRITICDNGIGMDKDLQGKIFESFITTKSASMSCLGVSLYMSKWIVEKIHNGSIWFESELNKGTKMFIELPGEKPNGQG